MAANADLERYDAAAEFADEYRDRAFGRLKSA
jgi:hypothetical protein